MITNPSAKLFTAQFVTDSPSLLLKNHRQFLARVSQLQGISLRGAGSV